MLIHEQIRKTLFDMQDKEYGVFLCFLIPTVAPETVIGVRTPELRRYAKQLLKQADISEFLSKLPHYYFDENQLHAFIISETKEYTECIKEAERFLPYINNWATCDQLSPKVFKKHRQELLEHIKVWMRSDETYSSPT